jgi:predicted Holliday junction resolvase-like endonuclease
VFVYYNKKRDCKLNELEQGLKTARENYDKLLSQKKSSEIRLGFLTEHLAPVLKEFPYDLEDENNILIPLGNPIDYCVITANEIAFVEIKTGESQLNAHQKHIKKLVEDKAIVWKLLRIKPNAIRGHTT